MAGVDQAECHGEIVRCDRPGLRNGSYRMVEGDARVPDRVEDPVGDCGDIAAVGMQQQHVEIAAWKEFAPAVAAHGHEGHPDRRRWRKRVEQAGEPGVGQFDQGRAPFGGTDRVVPDNRGAHGQKAPARPCVGADSTSFMKCCRRRRCRIDHRPGSTGPRLRSLRSGPE